MQKVFLDAAMQLDGPGWAWLVFDREENVHVLTTENSVNPIVLGENYEPILALDLWEHAYVCPQQKKGVQENLVVMVKISLV